jgi:phosphohistidine phosphatase SixA
MKTVVLIRHAHRDTTRREEDNGLSEKGEKQALAVREDLLAHVEGIESARLCVSPKRRCRQTLEPLAKALGAKLEIEPVLDEGADPELVGRWISKQASDILIVCSHGDILPGLSRILLGGRMELEFKKSTVVAVGLGQGEVPRLLHYVRKP